MQNERIHWEERYAQGFLPWDSGITPPEVESFWSSNWIPVAERQGAVALDMGCGTGTNLVYLARQGLSAYGVEVAQNGLRVARERLRRNHAQLRPRIHLVQGSVTQLPFHALGARYVLDIGCFHTIHPNARAAYAAGVMANLSPGGYYHLYAFDWMADRANDPEKSPRGMRENEVATLFASVLCVVDITRAAANPHPCRWYLLQKTKAYLPET